jgi:hypothetical protein
MGVRLFCNEIETPVSPFIERFVGNVGRAIAASLKAPQPAKRLVYLLEGDGVRIQSDGSAVTLDCKQGFARTIVLDTLRGMVCHLKGIDPNGSIRIELDLEAKS